MTSPRLRGVLFDLDGTLYQNAPMRRLLMRDLLLATLKGLGGKAARRRIKIIKAYRHALEELRGREQPFPEGWRNAQRDLAADRAGVTPEEVATTVGEWMERHPLRYMARCAQPGLRQTLSALRDAGQKLGVFSDYPVAEKLQALGVSDLFPVQLHAGDPDVPRPKPHPDGMLAACHKMGIEPAECAYVGDRPEVDAVAAHAAGLPRIVILCAPGAYPADQPVPHRQVERMADVVGVLLADRATG